MSTPKSIDQNRTVVDFDKRELSYLEYFHACTGHAKRFADRPRENTLILEGEGMVDASLFADAVDRAVVVNPAVVLKLVGKRRRASWVRAGKKPGVRVVTDSQWLGLSEKGSEFIYATKLSLEDGVTCEFILVEGVKNFIIFRNLHAVLDGVGTMHFLADVFNALNGRPLVGTNTLIKDTELMQSVKSTQFKAATSKKVARLTGEAQGVESGDSWCRLSIEGPRAFLLPKLAITLAEFARQYSDNRILISVPVNMRRHRPGMHSTMNYTCISYIDVEAGDDASKFQKKLHKQLANNSEAFYMRAFELMRYIPFSWLDRLLNKILFETAMISDMGLYSSTQLSGGGFNSKALFGMPISGMTYCLICTMDKNISIMLGMPKIYAGNGRLEKVAEYISRRLEE